MMSFAPPPTVLADNVTYPADRGSGAKYASLRTQIGNGVPDLGVSRKQQHLADQSDSEEQGKYLMIFREVAEIWLSPLGSDRGYSLIGAIRKKSIHSRAL
jgi:hypothetical protein